MKTSDNVCVFIIVPGLVCSAIAIVLVVSGYFGESWNLMKLGIMFAIFAIVLCVLNLSVIIKEYADSRKSASGKFNYDYYRLKKKTYKDLKLSSNFDDASTSFGIKQDFEAKAKLLGVDPQLIESDYQYMIDRIK